ncbi:MAG TPA: GNAT family N-acetyltransferase, partial [Rhodospirillaceae bacterium]|nr:GNAT family N-acetyltransferase [Rhodospirillaceae bacterium]
MGDQDITFRAAEEADLLAIVDMLADDEIGRTREKPGTPLAQAYLDAFAAMDNDPNHVLAVAVDGDTVIGTLQVSFIPGMARTGMWRGQIEAVRIVPAYRNGGLGRRMFEWAI